MRLIGTPGLKRFSNVRFSLPWAPSTNAVWRVGKTADGRGRCYRSTAYDEFISEVYALAFTGKIPGIIEAPYYAVAVYCYPPTRRRYDVDNRLKATFDALTRCGFWADDSHVCAATVYKCEPVPGGMLGLEVEAVHHRRHLVPPESFQNVVDWRK